jgi:hypothetical protein
MEGVEDGLGEDSRTEKRKEKESGVRANWRKAY